MCTLILIYFDRKLADFCKVHSLNDSLKSNLIFIQRFALYVGPNIVKYKMLLSLILWWCL